MTEDARVQELLDELLDSHATPEEVCGSCPELLPVIRNRWQELCRLQADLDALFPPSGASPPQPPERPTLPPIPGYEVDWVLGRGGMGIVFRARHLRLNRLVAVKMMLAGAYAAPRERERFQREAVAVAALRHPNIVQVHDVGEHDGRPYFTMEFVEGGSLAQKLAGTPQAARQAAELVATLAGAVQAAHTSGIVHRDLKPGNVLLTSDGTPKISDFGLARRVGDGAGLTLTGVAVGTPSYMAPEQALGRPDAVGTSVDVYALGAILYECLTGRPPFKAETAIETQRQVIAEEPAAPSRLNAKVPRDLETICLKCLHKAPTRRYASAKDLADDLHRFLEGKPVRARPVGFLEQAVKWVRRRPATALLVAALLALSATAVGAGVWLRQQEEDRQHAKEQREGQARDAIGTALRRADDLRREERWKAALLVLAGAEPHLADANSPELEQRLRRAQSDFQIAAALERIRESSTLMPNGEIDYRRQAADYQEEFERAGLRISEVQPTVATIQASAIRDQFAAALDDWAIVAFVQHDRPLAGRLLEIARSADPEPRWGDRFRTLAAWESVDRLRELADAALTNSPPPPSYQLALLGFLLRQRGLGYREAELLGEACRRRPDNFWLNREAGDAHIDKGRLHDSIGYYRAALAARPENARVHTELAVALFRVGQVDGALDLYRRAIELDPTSHAFRARLVSALAQTGYWKDAEAECRRALDADPGNCTAPFHLAVALQEQQRSEEAIILFQTALRIKADDYFVNHALAQTFQSLRRRDEAVRALRREIELLPPKSSVPTRRALVGQLVAAGRLEEAIAEAQTALALAPDDSELNHCLGLALRAQGRLDEAAAVFRKVVEDPGDYIVPWQSLATIQLDRGDFAEARRATVRLLALLTPDAARRAARRQIELCDLLLAVEAKIPAILAGKELPTDVPTRHALAVWCLKHKRLTATAADFYASALAAQPSLADDSEAGNRFHAARAAGLAGCGLGADAAQLDDRRRAELRKQALGWLTADYTAWAEKHRRKPADRTAAATAVRAWLSNPDLAGVRDEQALAGLLADERRAWQSLWANVAALAARDPTAKVEQARAHVARREWAQAAKCYAEGMELEPTDDGNIWFEFAASQLLADDRAGYRRSCAHMLDRCQPAGPMRPYLVARACTLAPDWTDDPTQALRLAAPELNRHGVEFWALTEQGAMYVRTRQPKNAVPEFELSMVADSRPGRTVLNWLWLALAYQKMDRPIEARRWLAKAVNWLDQQEGRMPLETDTMRLHLHNWLEAHVLRREAEGLIP